MTRELGERVVGQAFDHARTEAGGQAVGWAALGDVTLDDVSGGGHPPASVRVEHRARPFARHADDVFGREAETVEL